MFGTEALCPACGATSSAGSFVCCRCLELIDGVRAVRSPEELLFCDHLGLWAHTEGYLAKIRASLVGATSWINRIAHLYDLGSALRLVRQSRGVTRRSPEMASAFLRNVSELYASILVGAHEALAAEEVVALGARVAWSDDMPGRRVRTVLIGDQPAEQWNGIIAQWVAVSGKSSWSRLEWRVPLLTAGAIASIPAPPTNPSLVRWRLVDASGFVEEAKRIVTGLDATAGL